MRLTMSLLAIGLASTTVAEAAMSRLEDSPYNGIAPRNLFGLHAPVIVLTATPAVPVAPPKITLTGITTIYGKRVAFVTVAAIRPGQPPESFMLAEGQRFNEVEVTAIDEKAGVVRVMNHGESQVLDFVHDGVRPSDLPPRDPMPRENTLPRPEPGMRAQAALTPEEQVALIEIQRVKFQQENNPIHTILPQTEMTPETRGNR
jgi:hypothetical protein